MKKLLTIALLCAILSTVTACSKPRLISICPICGGELESVGYYRDGEPYTGYWHTNCHYYSEVLGWGSLETINENN